MLYLLTCKVGETIINSFDGTYDKFTLKKWSDKNLLKCPVCNSTYEYCHGEYVSPYFRHKEKNCSGYYSEPETDEHRQGKIKLYNWIKSQKMVTDCKLEAWIPETKQRPDIYFEIENKKYVIEFQCTPIASEYHEKYKLNKISDIWVLGIDKYKIKNQYINNNGVILRRYGREKIIEKEQSWSNLFYLDVKNNLIIINNYFLNRFFKRKRYRENYYAFELEEFNFENNKIVLRNEKFIKKLEEEKQKEVENVRRC